MSTQQRLISSIFILTFLMTGSLFAKGLMFNQHEILKDSKQVEYQGNVVAVPTPYSQEQGLGLTLSTEQGGIVFYGLGPIWYWESKQLTRPKVGDNIKITAYEVEINGKMYYVAKSLILANGDSLELRDENAYPVWVGGKSKKFK